MPFQEDLEHADRRWKAEEENARRLSVRSRILSTVGFGLFGLVLAQGLNAIGAGRLPVGPGGATVVILISVGLLAFLGALGCLFLPSRGGDRKRMPSWKLTLPVEQRIARESYMDEILASGYGSEESEALRLRVADIFCREDAQALRSAATTLQARNTIESKRNDWAQGLLLTGLLLIVCAGGVWMYTLGAEGGVGNDQGGQAADEAAAQETSDVGEAASRAVRVVSQAGPKANE